MSPEDDPNLQPSTFDAPTPSTGERDSGRTAESSPPPAPRGGAAARRRPQRAPPSRMKAPGGFLEHGARLANLPPGRHLETSASRSHSAGPNPWPNRIPRFERSRRRMRPKTRRWISCSTSSRLLSGGGRRRNFRRARARGYRRGRCRGRGRKIRRACSGAGISRFRRTHRIRRRADDRSGAAARAQGRLRPVVVHARAPPSRLGTHREVVSRAHQHHRKSHGANQGRVGGEYRRARVLACIADRAASGARPGSVEGPRNRSARPEAESQARQCGGQPARDSGRRAEGQARCAGGNPLRRRRGHRQSKECDRLRYFRRPWRHGRPAPRERPRLGPRAASEFRREAGRRHPGPGAEIRQG